MPEKVNGTKFSGKSNIESLNSSHSPIDSKSAVQLNSTELKLATLQRMADNSPYSQRYAHLTSLANNNIQNQPVRQLSKDSHSLPDNVKQGVESLSGISMDDVKVHYNSAKPAQLNAHAYAQGTDIHIASGQEKHLPHEAWHVVQQKQGRVQPTTMMKAKVPINDDQGLEKEADVMGARALQMKPFSLSDYKTGKAVQRKGIVQKVKKSVEAKWDAHINPKEREAFSDDKDARADLAGAITETQNSNEEERISAEKERISALKLSKIKFNFAGSGESTWKTRKKKYDKFGIKKQGFEKAEHMYDGKKMVKQKENKAQKGTRSMVVEYAGPIKRWDSIAFWKKGASDTGKNSTAKNLEDAQKVITEFLSNQEYDLMEKKTGEGVYHEKMLKVKIDIDIKGFSRGAATASTFAAWLKSKYGENFNVNLLLIDPVDGHKQHAEMEKEVDVTEVHDEEKPDTTGTTLMMPIKSKHEWITNAFTPQKISGYQRLILIYGSSAKHSFGLGAGIKDSTLTYNRKPIRGMKFTKLPKGLFVVDSEDEDLELMKVSSMALWRNLFKGSIVVTAAKGEERDKVIINLEKELAKYMK